MGVAKNAADVSRSCHQLFRVFYTFAIATQLFTRTTFFPCATAYIATMNIIFKDSIYKKTCQSI